MAQQIAQGITQEEWDELPITFRCGTVARIIGSNVRYVQNHPEEFGGVKVAGHWLFSKSQVASLLGLA